MKPALGVVATLLVLACCACGRADRAKVAPPAEVTAAADTSLPGASSASDASDASDASARSADAAPPDHRVPVQRHPLTDGAFSAAFLESPPPVAVRVTALPFTVLPVDQRIDRGTVEPADDDLRRAMPPFTQLGTYRDAKGERFLALVEARPQGTYAEAGNAPVVWWFAAKSPPRPLAPPAGKATSWRVWKGAAGHRQWNPDVLALENAAGEVVAVRYLGAATKVEPLALDPATPMFLVSVLGSASGVDDEITLLVVGLLGAELRVLRAITAGPRSATTAKEVLGPLGSIAAVAGATKDGRRALRLREVEPNEDAPCTPGTMTDPGCNGTEQIEAWDPTARRFVPGVATKIVLRQKSAAAPVVISPRAP